MYWFCVDSRKKVDVLGVEVCNPASLQTSLPCDSTNPTTQPRGSASHSTLALLQHGSSSITNDNMSTTTMPMPSRDPSTTPDERKASSSASSSTGKDGLDKVELSDLDSSPPRLPIEQDLMQLARLGELRSIQRLFDTGKFSARSTDEQGITALPVSALSE